MEFRTKLDFSTNRQVKQYPETLTVLSGATSFGLPFSALTTGPDLTTSGITTTINGVVSTFSGNSSTDIYNWYNNDMQLGFPELSAWTSSNSGITQNTGIILTSNTTTFIDNNFVVLSYSGISFDVTPISMVSLGGGNYSGTVYTNVLDFYSANTLDFTGRTIWADVSGITRTERLIITNDANVGDILTCITSEGMVDFKPITDLITIVWISGTGLDSAVLNNSSSNAFGINSVAEGLSTYAAGDYAHSEGSNSVASGSSSHAEGELCFAIAEASHAEGFNTYGYGQYSHAEGNQTVANGIGSHAEGNMTYANGSYSHAEGSGTYAMGGYSHAEGWDTIASGSTSHAGGYNSQAIGNYSFVHGLNSVALADNTIVLGPNLTGNTTGYTYVSSLNIKNVGSGAFVNQIRIDGSGNLTTNTSDIRLKENIKPINNALNTIKELKGVTYQWKDRIAGGDDVKLGFIAQDVQKAEPRLVFENKNDSYLGIHIDSIIPLLVEAIKEISTGKTSVNNTILNTQTIVAEDNNIVLNHNGNNATSVGGGIIVNQAINDVVGAELVTDENGNWTTNNTFKPKDLSIPYYTPSSSLDNNGNTCSITYDIDYIYIKTINGWKRTKLESF